MSITVNKPDYLASFYVPLFNPILFTFTATAGETKVIIQVKDSIGTILQDNIILLFDSSNVVVFDAAPYLKPQNSNALNAGQYTIDINNTNSIVEFYLSWDQYPQASPTSYEDTTHFYATNAVLQIGNTAGNNLYNQIAISPKEGLFLTEFEKVRHWEGYPQSIGWINTEGGLKKITTSSGVVSLIGYTSILNTVFEIILPDKGENYTIEMITALTFLTEWNTSIDGNFTAVSTLSSGLPTWVLPDGTEETISSLNTANSSIDGDLNTIGISGDLTSLELISKKCSSELDLRNYNLNGALNLDETGAVNYGFNTILLSDSNTLSNITVSNNYFIEALDLTGATLVNTVNIQYNPVLTSLTFSGSNTFGAAALSGNQMLTSLDVSNLLPASAAATFQIQASTLLSTFVPMTGTMASFKIRSTKITSIDISGIISDIIQIDTTATLTSIILTSSAKVVTILECDSNNASTINQGGLIYDSTTIYVDFKNNSMTQGEVDTLIADTDSRALSLSSATIDFSGTNAAPTGGAANANVVSLVAKGFSVTITP